MIAEILIAFWMGGVAMAFTAMTRVDLRRGVTDEWAINLVSAMVWPVIWFVRND